MGPFRVNFQLAKHLPTETVLREHALDRTLDHELGLALEQVTVALRAEAARITRVTVRT
jgi:hypothetical protein